MKLPGSHHYIYLSHEADVIREIRSFTQPTAVAGSQDGNLRGTLISMRVRVVSVVCGCRPRVVCDPASRTLRHDLNAVHGARSVVFPPVSGAAVSVNAVPVRLNLM